MRVDKSYSKNRLFVLVFAIYSKIGDVKIYAE